LNPSILSVRFDVCFSIFFLDFLGQAISGKDMVSFISKISIYSILPGFNTLEELDKN